MTTYTTGSLVRARGREWVVREAQGDLLILQPLAGSEEETTGIWTPLEPVESATFDLPNPAQVGDYRSARLLREALRLSSRSGGGPFRSLSRIAVEPRPYQAVPMLMALKLDPIRLLIADDVGIGKTVEAAWIARELLDRGEIRRLAVLCPPHLAEQWQEELATKFHIDAALVLASTAARLERDRYSVDQSLFDLHPHVVVSLDFIKTEGRRAEFLRSCPEFVIVDEAHTCAQGAERGRHQRFELVRDLAAAPERHMVFVTATPHTGNEAAFRSLLGLLDPEFSNLPENLSGEANRRHRERLAAHFVQRRRADLRSYLAVETKFPKLEDAEDHYDLTPEYARFLERILDHVAEITDTPDGTSRTARVRWWSALALLRSVTSSPAAAAATLRNRAPGADGAGDADLEEIGRRAVLDLETDDETEGVDLVPGADPSAESAEDTDSKKLRKRLLGLAREAEKLSGKQDGKLVRAIELTKKLIQEGYRPILFCRFIPTAEYVADALRKALKDAEVGCVTGTSSPEEREARVLAMKPHEKRVLVCTDCLSEGINLQDLFDAVLHYDLAWSPTRHEQRQGRVDRFGQSKPIVRALTYYGRDNGVDGIVLDILIRKHKTIRSSLGINVPVPVENNTVVEALMEGLKLRSQTTSGQGLLNFMQQSTAQAKRDLHVEWDRAWEREKASRTLFAQQTLSVDEVQHELDEARTATGGHADVRRFCEDAIRACGGVFESAGETYRVRPLAGNEHSRDLRERLHLEAETSVCFEPPVAPGVQLWSRTNAAVQGLSELVLDGALDAVGTSPARRAGAIRTAGVTTRTTLILLRLRFDLALGRGEQRTSQLVEEVRLAAFEGAPDQARWLAPPDAEALLDLEPAANITASQAADFVRAVTEGFKHLVPHLEDEARARSEALLESHRRVRQAARSRIAGLAVEPRLPADVLGVYVFLPAGAAR